jgi:hypothetical protein
MTRFGYDDYPRDRPMTAPPTPPMPTAADLQETAYDPSEDREHVEATRVGLRHTEWRRAPWGPGNERQGVEPW